MAHGRNTRAAGCDERGSEPAAGLGTADRAVARLLEQLREGRPAALARAVSIVENHRAGFEQILAAQHAVLGRARRIGITGPPGAGKSTLTTRLARHYRHAGLTVGLVAVPPTSPFTGRALPRARTLM